MLSAYARAIPSLIAPKCSLLLLSFPGHAARPIYSRAAAARIAPTRAPPAATSFGTAALPVTAAAAELAALEAPLTADPVAPAMRPVDELLAAMAFT
jgi:hypothetical protein